MEKKYTKTFSKNEVNAIKAPCVLKQSIAKEFPDIITRIGNSKHQTVNTKLLENHRVIHQKGRKVPVHLQSKVKIELEKMLNEGHIEKLSKCSDQFFIFPIVIPVKKDHSFKLALD